jgi:hypothetical protein
VDTLIDQAARATAVKGLAVCLLSKAYVPPVKFDLHSIALQRKLFAQRMNENERVIEGVDMLFCKNMCFYSFPTCSNPNTTLAIDAPSFPYLINRAVADVGGGCLNLLDLTDGFQKHYGKCIRFGGNEYADKALIAHCCQVLTLLCQNGLNALIG